MRASQRASDFLFAFAIDRYPLTLLITYLNAMYRPDYITPLLLLYAVTVKNPMAFRLRL